MAPLEPVVTNERRNRSPQVRFSQWNDPVEVLAPDESTNLSVAISAGIQFSCALRGDSTVRCWGENDGGQLGNGSLSAIVPTPVTVVNGS
jgi:hypothetical protein